MRTTFGVLSLVAVAFAFAGCDSGGTRKVATDTQVVADTAPDVPVAVDPGTGEDAERDVQPDVPPDPGTPDVPDVPDVPDLPPDPGPPDLPDVPDVPPDPGPPDVPADLGPQYSDNVLACEYVMTSICSKALTKCDFLGLIPKEWMDKCTKFLVDNDKTIVAGCETIDNAETSDPNVAIIKDMGPKALRECVDNFQCNAANIGKIIDLGTKFFGDTKPETTDILGVVVDLCFK